MKGYIVISAMGDGGVSIREYSGHEFEEEAAKGPMGYIGVNPHFISQLNKDMLFSMNDLRQGDMIVIKGEIVVPKPVEIVKSFTLDV